MKRSILLCYTLLSLTGLSAQSAWNPGQHAVIQSSRSDGRFSSSYAIAHQLIKNTRPSLAFRPDFTPKEFRRWQDNVAKAMNELMCFPDYRPEKAPVCVSREPREGYTLEKWEFYPLPEAVCTFLVLRPDQADTPRPAVLCIPGSGMSKEGLAGEPGETEKLNDDYRSKRVTMAKNFALKGYVAVDNPAAGESSDLEKYTHGRSYDYDVVSRMLLEVGWSYLGYTS